MKKKLLALFAAAIMVMFCFAGCGGSGNGGAEGDGDNELTEDEAQAAIQAMLPETCLSGYLIESEIQDRSDVEKGLPFEPKDPDHVVIGMTEQTAGDPWFVSVGEGAQATCDKYGYTLYYDIADFDLASQSGHVDSYISRGVDVIVIDPVDVTGVTADVERAVEAGIPCIGIGSEIVGAPVVTTVTGNLFMTGFAAGKYCASTYDPEEPIVMGIVIGVMGNTTAETRVNGMMSGMIYERATQRGEDFSRAQAAYDATVLFQELRKSGTFESEKWGIKCVGIGEGQWTFDGGLEQAEPIIAAHADELNFFIGENDFQGLGIAQALSNYGLTDKVKVGCPGNGMKTELEKVKDGTLLCDGTHNGWAFAEGCIDLVHHMATNDIDVDFNNLPMVESFRAFNINNDTMDLYWDDDPDNLYHKTPELEIIDVPTLKENVKSGYYYEEWVPED